MLCFFPPFCFDIVLSSFWHLYWPGHSMHMRLPLFLFLFIPILSFLLSSPGKLTACCSQFLFMIIFGPLEMYQSPKEMSAFCTFRLQPVEQIIFAHNFFPIKFFRTSWSVALHQSTSEINLIISSHPKSPLQLIQDLPTTSTSLSVFLSFSILYFLSFSVLYICQGPTCTRLRSRCIS